MALDAVLDVNKPKSKNSPPCGYPCWPHSVVVCRNKFGHCAGELLAARCPWGYADHASSPPTSNACSRISGPSS